MAKWTRCQLSGQPLNPPCVSDELGHLFNKDAIVNALMEKTVPPALAHISRYASLWLLLFEVYRSFGTSLHVAAMADLTPVSGPQLEAPDSSQAAANTHRRGGSAGGRRARAGQRSAVLLSHHGAGAQRPVPVCRHAQHGSRHQPACFARGERQSGPVLVLADQDGAFCRMSLHLLCH